MSGLLPPIPEYSRAPRCGEHAKMAARNNFLMRHPLYFYLRKIFCNLLMREGFDCDYVLDWTILEYLGLCQAELT